MDLYTRTEAARILDSVIPNDAIEINDPTDENRLIGYVWTDTSGESVHPIRLYTPYHPATISVRDSVEEATRYVVRVFNTFGGNRTHLDDPTLL